MACVPGTPCFENTSNAYYPQQCNNGWFAGYPIPTSSIQYNGPNLPNSGVDTGDGMNVAMQKLDNALEPIELVQTLITVINQNPSLQVMFCTLVNSCIYSTTTTTTTVTPTTTTTTSSSTSTTTSTSTSTTTTTTTASAVSQTTVSSAGTSLLCEGFGGEVTVFYNGNIGLPSALLYTDAGLTVPYNQSFFGTYIRLFFNGEYNICTMNGNTIQSYTACGAFIDIANAYDVDQSPNISIDAVRVNGIAATPVGPNPLPCPAGSNSNLTTPQIGTYTIEIDYSNALTPGQRISLTDSTSTTTCQNIISVSGTLTFTSQVVNTVINPLISVKNLTC